MPDRPLRDIVASLETLAPLSEAEPWDNVGLLWGDETMPVGKVLACIDYTPAVAEEARTEKAGLVVAYHPAIFSGLKRLPGQSPIFGAIRAGIALYSPHTALDVAPGGTNDVLADAVGLGERAPLRRLTRDDRHKKLVTFVPEEALDRVAQALFEAGAGWIGNYSACSFRTPGTGTFFGEEGAAPRVGEAGKLERVAETRLETLVSDAALPAVVRALYAAHPYETPAFDLVRIAEPPVERGLGRIGPWAGERAELVQGLKEKLGLEHVLVAGPANGRAKRVAVAAGAGGALLDDAVKQKADVFVTGELKHHDALRAAARGMTVVMTLHSNSERAALASFGARLGAALPGLEVTQSRADRDPFSIR